MSLMPLKQRNRTTTRKRRFRISLAVLLFVVALLWPLLNIGLHGPTLVAITHEHGVDTGDFLALIPLTLAIALVPWRSRADRKKPPPVT
jgi:hypothetical protein